MLLVVGGRAVVEVFPYMQSPLVPPPYKAILSEGTLAAQKNTSRHTATLKSPLRIIGGVFGGYCGFWGFGGSPLSEGAPIHPMIVGLRL